MADEETRQDVAQNRQEEAAEQQSLEGGAYEVLRKRLEALDGDLCSRLEKLNVARKEVFGGKESQVIGNDRIPTDNNCVPRDITGVGDYVIFGYNVFIGLRTQTKIGDVLSVHLLEDTHFRHVDNEVLSDPRFVKDFTELYTYYKHARFLQFVRKTGSLLIIFQTGASLDDVCIFRFQVNKDDTVEYIDNRGDIHYKLPAQHEFEWVSTTRDNQVQGMHPHISVDDRVFVECTEGDLTIKVENNTETGEGVYSEPVDNKDQTLDDADIRYAIVGDLILFRIRPYREDRDRHLVFNQKRQTAVRMDSIAQACIQLPEDHGIITPKGYYLQDGRQREFDENVEGMGYLECIKSPNGEDFLYIFYHVAQGRHVLIQYNLISKELSTPIFCHGYSLYGDGRMVLFSAPDEEPKRIHPMQVWQTPFYADTHEVTQDADSFLGKIGNRALVRGISEGYAISRLITSSHITLETYHDSIRATTHMLDGYHWLGHEDVFDLQGVVQQVKAAAVAAVDEYEKVVTIRESTEQQLRENDAAVRDCLLTFSIDRMESIDDYVNGLAGIRSRRGHIISLRELRYVDLELIDRLDGRLEERSGELALSCVDFLLRPDALKPYTAVNTELDAKLEEVGKIADLKPIIESLEDLAGRLDLLTDIVNNLEIDDATKTTRIVDSITDVYAGVNRTRAMARTLRQDIGKVEAKAEFAAQFKLVSQSITNYIGMCDTPEKCDELLTKVMVTVEELEGRFADYEEYVTQLAEKREEAYTAFSSRKQVLDEERKRRVSSLVSSAERILKGVVNRAETFESIDEVNAYFASDLMVSKVRDAITRLHEIGDSVKADDLTGRLRSSKDELIRHLRDKIDLFQGGDNIISFGDYRFTVNTQPLELTTVYRDDEMVFHLTGTDFYEAIEDPEFLATRDLWQQQLVSESRDVYRGEFLAYQMLTAAINGQSGLSTGLLTEKAEAEELLPLVREFSAALYDEGYERGVHDHDAGLILTAIIQLYNTCELLRYDSTSRGHAILFWCFYEGEDVKTMLRTRMRSVGTLPRIFGHDEPNLEYIEEIRKRVEEFHRTLDLDLDAATLAHSAEYLYYELQDTHELEFTVNALAHQLHQRFIGVLRGRKALKQFEEDIAAVDEVARRIDLIADWVSAFIRKEEPEDSAHFLWEVVALIAAGEVISRDTTEVTTFAAVKGVLGQHPLIHDKTLDLHFDRFLIKMKQFAESRVPTFRTYVHLRAELTEKRRREMRLSEFQSKVMGSFVRNKLINDVYLNLVGANFAKQMGVAGEAKRTDLMGLLLLVSPPGYGKTTLMEYVANRLGLTFMKVNGPAIGHQVTSLDPVEAPNATAREELGKLNLAFEMGNNIMIYLDDIQHLNPELLQKFISLCDAQRKIEGVYRGVTRTYDLRGKKVAVVMAGNPYTESGEKFRIPDMLANRADTYNLGDISSTAADAFALSFVENAMTSNPVLSKIASHGHEDIYRFMDVVRKGSQEGIEFDYSYSAAEAKEITDVLAKLCTVRDVVLRVNSQYIASAAQEDDYRTEPPFRLQGSYRNMNRMAEKVFPVMTDEEVIQVVFDHYYNEAQTLTTGAESNILKFKEMMQALTDDEQARWQEIRTEFGRRQVLSGVDDTDDLGKILAQLSGFNAGMGRIRDTLNSGLGSGMKALTEAVQKTTEKGPDEGPSIDLAPVVEALQQLRDAPKQDAPATQALPGYDEALAKQVSLLECLVPMVEHLEEQSITHVRIRELIEGILSGNVVVAMNSGGQ
ncbi:MAG: AAA family ATPase [Lentisphaerae bacterium]|jgi:hypothetical protein|nr:AAA family ATPase [Lentisphaerota bacterium]MBT4820827.1 AAA family ATPase [Lentisphaerota bacterium]MBT5604723.1 AAA family ATPase [Lentisphaerota bacterium]MBT7058103.1 AAA family ATPase [Lentisphaerota bacterium]MBT7841791.1 AAA family ATPase [Lentisphaerota bacterium]